MRLHLTLSKADNIVDFNYQPLLTGCVHKWLGENNLQHGKISLYSFSWLQNVDIVKPGIKIKDGSYFMLNLYDVDLVKIVIENIQNDPKMFFGVKVREIQIQDTPVFSEKERFVLTSPVLIKRYIGDEDVHFTFHDDKSNDYMTETLKTKAKAAGLDSHGLKVYFDKSYHSPKTKIVSYKDIQNKANFCPIIIEGTAEQIAFAWDVGVGNCTGIGFGALK